MRILTALAIAALVVAFAVPAFAETQNIKVSGDIKIAHIVNQAVDLDGSEAGVNNEDDDENFFMQQIGLNVEADLTDNVSTYVRIINERTWDAMDDRAAADNRDAFNITLDEAYVTLKEMLYAPLTVKIGRQNIWLGRGFVIGNAGVGVWDTQSALPSTIREVSDATAFDAIRATLDYDPWTIDLIYAKIDANGAAAVDPVNDDNDLYVANIGYDFTKYDAEAELYYILEHNKSGRVAPGGTSFDANATSTLGLRGSYVPFESMNVWAEGALQFGDYANVAQRREDIEAYAFNIGADYTFTDIRWTPMLTMEYTFLSGEEAGNANGDWSAWNPLYRGKFDSYIANFRNITKVTDYDVTQGVSANGNNNGVTNEHEFAVGGRINPMTDITVDGRATFLWFSEVPVAGNNDEIGWELDGKVTYDYTEDVTFQVAAGIFFPGSYYPETDDDNAAQIISAVTVEF